jgi:hypothetical protein
MAVKLSRQNCDTTAPSGRELYLLSFSPNGQSGNFGYTLVYVPYRTVCGVCVWGGAFQVMVKQLKLKIPIILT